METTNYSDIFESTANSISNNSNISVNSIKNYNTINSQEMYLRRNVCVICHCGDNLIKVCDCSYCHEVCCEELPLSCDNCLRAYKKNKFIAEKILLGIVILIYILAAVFMIYLLIKR